MLHDGGALYSDVVEEHAGGDDGLGDDAKQIRDVRVVADGDDAGAEAAIVEFVEDRTTDELTSAIGLDAIEKTWEEFAAQGFYGVDVLALFLRHGKQAFVEFVLRDRLIGFDQDNARARVRSLRRGSAAVAVGGGEVFDWLAANEEVFEFAVFDDVD